MAGRAGRFDESDRECNKGPSGMHPERPAGVPEEAKDSGLRTSRTNGRAADGIAPCQWLPVLILQARPRLDPQQRDAPSIHVEEVCPEPPATTDDKVRSITPRCGCRSRGAWAVIPVSWRSRIRIDAKVLRDRLRRCLLPRAGTAPSMSPQERAARLADRPLAEREPLSRGTLELHEPQET